MTSKVFIVIDVPGRTLHCFRSNSNYSSFPVAIGKPSTPTPRGVFTIAEKIENPGSVYGPKLLALSRPYYSIHGTNRPELIGQAVSNGCVRMYNHHIEEVYAHVEIGTIVRIPSDAEYWYDPDKIKKSKPTDGNIYYVKPGDTLWSIAKVHQTTVAEILRLNPNLGNPELIYPGQGLRMP